MVTLIDFGARREGPWPRRQRSHCGQHRQEGVVVVHDGVAFLREALEGREELPAFVSLSPKKRIRYVTFGRSPSTLNAFEDARDFAFKVLPILEKHFLHVDLRTPTTEQPTRSS